MTRAAEQLLAILETIEGSGAFFTAGRLPLVLPGLRVKDFGEVALPLPQEQAEALARVAHQAPFGKGSQTLVDTDVRRVMEIDADRLSFHNRQWNTLLNEIVQKTGEGLGIPAQDIHADLYKLLLYQTGDFFVAHRDSEKAPGMFGTLVVCLPSAHTGGEMIVQFEGRTEAVDFSAASSGYDVQFAAFFADCIHEIKPVTSGFRPALVYNLIQHSKGPAPAPAAYANRVGQLAQCLSDWRADWGDNLKVVMLSHQYTPQNFSAERLKGHDRPRAEALLDAAPHAGYFARLCLLTHYEMGSLEGGDGYYYDRYSYRNRGRLSEPEEQVMGEVYEEYTSINYWVGEGLGEKGMKEENLISRRTPGEGDEPVEKDAEEYTGNAGMTMEYWYHYGAVALWPAALHAQLVGDSEVSVHLDWIGRYAQDAPAKGSPEAALLHDLVEQIANASWNTDKLLPTGRYGYLADALIHLNDVVLVEKACRSVLPVVFHKISVRRWHNLLTLFPVDRFADLFDTVSASENGEQVAHLLRLLRFLLDSDSVSLRALATNVTGALPERWNTGLFKVYRLGNSQYREIKTKVARKIVHQSLQLAAAAENGASWNERMAKCLATGLKRVHLHSVLGPVLCRHHNTTAGLTEALRQLCVADLQRRVAQKPVPPADWSREAPVSARYQRCVDELADFLRSPVETTFDYRKSQVYRSEMEHAIKTLRLDLDMETIRKGSPHTLRLAKNRASYERAVRRHNQDMALLEKLKG